MMLLNECRWANVMAPGLSTCSEGPASTAWEKASRAGRKEGLFIEGLSLVCKLWKDNDTSNSFYKNAPLYQLPDSVWVPSCLGTAAWVPALGSVLHEGGFGCGSASGHPGPPWIWYWSHTWGWVALVWVIVALLWVMYSERVHLARPERPSLCASSDLRARPTMAGGWKENCVLWVSFCGGRSGWIPLHNP